MLAAMTTQEADLVMLGDSLTEFGEWSALLPGVRVVNRGIRGNTTGDLDRRLEDALRVEAPVYSLTIGINDLSRGATADEVIEGIVGLIARVRARWPAALMIVTSVPPIDPAQFGSMELVATVQRVNAAIAARAPALGARYLDIGAAMATTQGTLRPELSEDGVHLTEAAYLLWAATLRATLRGKAGR